MIENDVRQKPPCKKVIPPDFCVLSDCRRDCYALYNGVGKCVDDRKTPGPSNCGCIYNC